MGRRTTPGDGVEPQAARRDGLDVSPSWVPATSVRPIPSAVTTAARRRSTPAGVRALVRGDRSGYRLGMTTAPFEPGADPDLVPGGDPDELPDPLAPGQQPTDPVVPEPGPTES